MKLTKAQGNFGVVYETLDGHYRIERELYERQCECASCRAGNSESGFGGHPYACDPGWIVWDKTIDDYPRNLGSTSFETKRDAVAWIEKEENR